MKNDYIKGSILTVVASLWWGVIGVFYFKSLSFVNPIELVVHRTIWTALLLIITTFFLSKWNIFFKIINNKKLLFLLLVSGFLVMTNWLTWLYAISIDRLIDASLGYYIFPILSVFFGVIFWSILCIDLFIREIKSTRIIWRSVCGYGCLVIK